MPQHWVVIAHWRVLMQFLDLSPACAALSVGAPEHPWLQAQGTERSGKERKVEHEFNKLQKVCIIMQRHPLSRRLCLSLFCSGSGSTYGDIESEGSPLLHQRKGSLQEQQQKKGNIFQKYMMCMSACGFIIQGSIAYYAYSIHNRWILNKNINKNLSCVADLQWLHVFSIVFCINAFMSLSSLACSQWCRIFGCIADSICYLVMVYGSLYHLFGGYIAVCPESEIHTFGVAFAWLTVVYGCFLACYCYNVYFVLLCLTGFRLGSK